ncbi:BTAD domain-containing putative transcriptional regulator [Kitasatospora sp. CMC57]|uniref:BTAD domain-containing putative transcriptional regulator n=1 Tax=Kitasatospora sp. CMC57 TaxID=3231513 RepID=A0AB33JRP5_9ACTN
MRFGLLGSLLAQDADRECPVRGPKARTLLAVLLLNAGQPVSLDRLILALWAEGAPSTAEQSLRNLVARLRKALGDEDGDRLRAVRAGYLLRVADTELDTRLFEEGVRRARAAHTAGDSTRVLTETAAALDLWRGMPLLDLPDLAAEFLPQCEQWQEDRLQMLEWRFGAELQLDRPQAVVAELTGLTGEHPLREAFHGQLMLALHRSGQRAQALAVYQRLRRTLIDELGIEPGPSARELHQLILSEEQPAAEPGRPARTAPDQLPSDPLHFVGRSDSLATLGDALLRDTGRARYAVVSGMAGVGKSALAVRCAHTMADHFPDGRLFLNLRGATSGLTPLTTHQAATALLRGLGVEPGTVPEDPEAAAALLRSTLAPTRTLLVLDDAAGLAQVRPLLPSGPGCAVLLTSRSPMLTLEGAAHLRLATLSEAESVALVAVASGRTSANREVVTLEQGDLTRLVELCGRLPLALRIVAARLAARDALPVRSLVAQLSAHEDRLDQLELDDLSIRQSLGLAVSALRGSERRLDRRAADTLLAVGALNLPEYSAAQLAGTLGTSRVQAAAALDRLVDVALLDEIRLDRFVPHDLVRDFARELAEESGRRSELTSAALHWYVTAAGRSALALAPELHRHRQLPGGNGAEEVADEDAALLWGDAECVNLLALVEQADREERDAAGLLSLVQALLPYLRARGRTAELSQLNRTALSVARREGNLLAQAHALGDLAGSHFDAGRFADALALIEEALPLWRQLDDVGREQLYLNNRGMLLQALGRDREAVTALEEALALAVARGDAHNEALALSGLGNVAEKSDPRLAILHHTRSIEAGKRSGTPGVQMAGLCNIGCAHLRLDEPTEALRYFREALDQPAGAAHWTTERQCRLGLIDALHRLRRLDEATTACHELLDRTSTLQDPYGEGRARHALGLILRDQAEPAHALGQWRAALELLTTLDAQEVAELQDLIASAAAA